MKACVTALVVIVAAVLVGASAARADTTCTGALTGPLSGNVVVPNNASCTLSGVTVPGNVTIKKNATLVVNGPATIQGNVVADSCRAVTLKGSTTVGGNVQIAHCTAASGYVGPGIQIGGDVQCQNNSAACVANRGTMGGNVQIQSNLGAAASDVSLNVVRGNLQCSGNVPPPTHTLGPNNVAGNAQAQCAAPLGFTIATLPPPSIAEPVVEGATVIGGTGFANAVVTVLLNGVVAGSGPVAPDATFHVLVSPLQAGAVVRATQRAVDLVSALSAPVTVHAVPPAPTVTPPLVEGATSVMGAGAPAAVVRIFVDNVEAGIGAAASDGTFTVTVGALVAGQQLQATQTIDGVESTPSAPLTVVSVPPAPLVTTPLVEGSTSLGGTGTASGTIEVAIDGATAGTTTVTGNGTWTLAVSALRVGSTVKARQTVAGVTSAFSADIIVVAPPPPPSLNAPLVATATHVGGTGAPGAVVTVVIDNESAGQTPVAPNGTWLLTLATPLVAGQIVQAAQAVAGVTGLFSAPVPVFVAPPAPYVDRPLIAGSTTITGAGTGGASVTVFIDGGAVGTAAVAVSAAWSLALASPLATGQVVVARQTFGDVESPWSDAVTVMSPTPPPDVDAALVAGDATIRGTGLNGASVEVFVDAHSVGTTSVNADFTWSLPVSPLTAGQVVTASETANGFTSPLSNAVVVGSAVLRQIAINPAPTASVVKRLTRQFTAQGSFSDGVVQTPLTGVTWSSSHPGVASISATGVATGVSPGIATIAASRSGATSAGTILTVTEPVAVSLKVMPADATLGLGDTRAFQATATFDDGTTLDRSAMVTWTSSASAVAPVSAAGVVTAQSEGITTITATDPTGLVADTRVTIVLPPPVITALVPASGASGTTVTIQGQYFQTAQGVAFNGVSAVVLQRSGTSIVTVVPIGATTGSLTVTTSRGTAAMFFTVLLSGDYTLDALPTAPATLKVIAGDRGYAAIQAGASGSFASLVSLGVSALPTGVTASFGPQLVAPGSSSFLALTVSDATPPAIYALTVSGTAQLDGRTVTRTVQVALEVLPPGTTAVTGQILTAESLPKPIPGVTVVLGSAVAFTDAAGNFMLLQAPAGPNLLFVDGRTASTPTAQFPIVETQIAVSATGVSRVPFVIYLPKLDTANAVNLSLDATGTVTQTTIVTTPAIPGLEITIPQGVRITGPDGNPVRQISVTPVPIDRSPMPFPPGITFPMLFAIHPGGAVPSQPLPINFPNVTDAAPGAKFDMYYFDLTIGNWNIWGTGTVGQDGKQVVADPGFGLPRFAWHSPYCASTCPTGDQGADHHGNDGDPVDITTGKLVVRTTDLIIPGRMPLRIERHYRSGVANTGMLGRSWTLAPWDVILRQDSGSALTLVKPDQGTYAFTSIGAGQWKASSEPGLQGAVITQLPGDFRFQLRFRDGTIHRFERLLGFANAAALAAISDRNGNTVTVTRDAIVASNRIMTITDPVGRALTFAYDASGRVVTITDPINRVLRYAYDSQGRLETATDLGGGTTTYAYDANHRIVTITDPRNITTLRNEYDGTGRVVTQTQADGGVWTFAYAGTGTETTATDPRGNATTHRFNAQGFTVSRTDSLGQVTTFDYGAGSNQLVGVTDALGRSTRYEYDAAGNVTRSVDPLGHARTFAYDSTFGQMTSRTDELGQTMRFEYDGKGNLVGTIDELNNRTLLTRDGFGQVTTITDPLSHAVTFAYDGLGNRVTVANPLGQTTTREYDAVGRMIARRDALGRTTRFGYDALDRMVSIQDAQGGVSHIESDPNGNVVAVVDPLGNTTGQSFDPRNRLAARTDAAGATETFVYDGRDNLVSRRDRNGNVTSYAYDTLNRLATVTYADGSTTGLRYDALGQAIEAVDSIGGTIQRSYDALSRLVSETTAYGSIASQYDPLGRRVSMGAPGQPPVRYQYDAASRLTSVAQGPQVTTLEYDAGGRRTRLILPNQIATDYGYDAASRVTSLVYRAAGNELGDLVYEYDALGNRIAEQGAFARTTLAAPIAHASYVAGNRQAQLGDAVMTYDANGNVTRVSEPSGETMLTWDVRDRLVAADGPASHHTFSYDALGRRVRRTDDGSVIDYIYDGVDVTQELTAGMATSYLRSPWPDEPFARNGAEFYLLAAPGSVIALTDAAGAVFTSYVYEPFGQMTSEGVSTNTLQYAARDHDPTALSYYRARYYSPSLRRFISEDPIGFAGGDPNLYAYVNGNPLAFTDPSGLDATILERVGPGGRTWGDGPRNGTWGGANWSGGLGPGQQGPPAPPRDSGDECYMHHDNCWGSCEACPSTQSGCMTNCDRDLVRCVRDLSRDPTQWARPPRPGTERQSRDFALMALGYFRGRVMAAELATAAQLGRLR